MIYYRTSPCSDLNKHIKICIKTYINIIKTSLLALKLTLMASVFIHNQL